MKTSFRGLILSLVLCPLSLLAGCGGGITTGVATTKAGGARADDQLESARLILAESPDRPACSTALQQLNAYVANHPERRPPPLTDDQKKLLQERFGLDPGELAEVESPTYTLLDAPHVEFCFLLRDVIRSLELDRLSPPEQAGAVFGWAMRQVAPQKGEAAFPPEFVLRRGWGTDQERAYVFLALLHQLGIPGCLVGPAGSATPWACGALVEVEGSPEKQILLFDHRLGLPLPGSRAKADGQLARAFRLASPVAGPEDGQQIVTLAQLCKQPELLRPLTTDDKHPYDVGAEQVKEALVWLAPPLSALSQRMRLLQDEFVSRRSGVRLAADPADLARQFGAAAGAAGVAGAVRGREGSAGLLRRFLGEEEGGLDKSGLHQRARRALWPDEVLPPRLADLAGDPGLRIRMYSAQQFIGFQLDPRQPRDLVLRGQYKEVAGQLTSMLEVLRIQEDRLSSDPEALTEFDQWKDSLYKAYGDAGRAQEEIKKGGTQDAAEAALAQREHVWKSGAKVLTLLIEGSTAQPRRGLAIYQLALCMHEQAERLQARADQLARAQPPADSDELKAAREEARGAWTDARGWWTSYLQKYPVTLVGFPVSLQARLLRARASDALGDRDQARTLLEDLPPDTGELQRVARLSLARRLRTP